MTIQQYAAKHSVSEKAVRRRIAAGKIPAERRGRVWRIDDDAPPPDADGLSNKDQFQLKAELTRAQIRKIEQQLAEGRAESEREGARKLAAEIAPVLDRLRKWTATAAPHLPDDVIEAGQAAFDEAMDALAD